MKKSVFIRRAALCVALIAILASCEMAGITVNPGNSDNLSVESKGLANSQKTSATSFLVTFDPTLSGNAGVVFSTTFGGLGQNWVTCLVRDTAGKILVGGYTTATSFPVTDGSVKGNPEGAPTGFYMLLGPDPK